MKRPKCEDCLYVRVGRHTFVCRNCGNTERRFPNIGIVK